MKLLLQVILLVSIIAVVWGQDDTSELDYHPNSVDDNPKTENRWTIQLLKNGKKRYYVGFFFKANYFKATQYCRYHGMDLASIDSQEENDELVKYVIDFGFDRIWTSGTDLAQHGSYFWMSTGRPITFTDWHDGEPNSHTHGNGEVEHCLEVRNYNSTIKWNDVLCSRESYFVCETYDL